MLTNLRQLMAYNTRILLSNSYWLLIIPVVASQLILFWHMAIATMVKASMIADSFELVVPLLAAFLCAHVVAPEHHNRVDELTFARPVPFARTILLRLLSMYLIVAGLAALMLFVYTKGTKSEFEPLPTLLAGVPSTLLLSLVALAFASAWRSAAIGIGAALACWLVDVAWGAGVNPIFTLHSYAVHLAATDAGRAPGYSWLLSKAALLVLALVAGLALRANLGRPAAPRRMRAVVRLGLSALPLVLAYLVVGAVWQFTQARRAAELNPTLARITYRLAFDGYGPLPMAYLFGADFAHYIGYPTPARVNDLATGEIRERTLKRLQSVALGHPDGAWADDALYEIIRLSEVSAPTSEDEVVARKVSVQQCRGFLERYPTSIYAPEVARRMVVLASLTRDLASMEWAYQLCLSAYRGTASAAETAGIMQQYYQKAGDIVRATQAAEAGVDIAPPTVRAEALLRLAGFYIRQKRLDKAHDAYSRVAAAVQAQLEAEGLAQISVQTTDAAGLRRRREITELRDQARDALAALDAGQLPPAAPAPAPPPRRGRH